MSCFMSAWVQGQQNGWMKVYKNYQVMINNEKFYLSISMNIYTSFSN